MNELARLSPFPEGMPYFTDKDPVLVRSLGTRYPLGFLPVWSAFARRLVPNVASPVMQIDGIKAVLLILWLGNDRKIADALLKGDEQHRRFFRLMEGIVEYWLDSNGRTPCYGTNALRAEAKQFALTADSGKTVANGLYQYYRGTCRRAGLIDKDWIVEAGIAHALNAQWKAGATDELISALKAPLTNTRVALVPAKHLSGTAFSASLARVFAQGTLLERFKHDLFGSGPQCDLVKQFRSMPEDMKLHESIGALQSPTLAHEIRCVLDCEPFLLVMQDVFDILRASTGEEIFDAANRIEEKWLVIAERASAFRKLQGELETGRMRQMQALAAILADRAQGASTVAAREALITFIVELVEFHQRCMVERVRDPLVIIEGRRIVSLVPDERGLEEALDRLSAGFPWMNDYYFRSTSRLHAQLFGPRQ